ncbi:MAG: hypothetical protein Q4F18_06370 [Clostridia bacterium]|nr:hypothetical protein [Clostridia bacterium]
MNSCRTLLLYGTPASREMAKLLLENQPQVRRVDAAADLSELKLLLTSALTESELIPLLAGSGISGFRLC